MSRQFSSILGTPIQGCLLHKLVQGGFLLISLLIPCVLGACRFPVTNYFTRAFSLVDWGFSSLCVCRGNFLLLQFCVGALVNGFLFLALALHVYGCHTWSFGQLRTIALDVTRLATSVADGPCSSGGNPWHCSDFSQLTLTGLGVTRSLVHRQLHLQYWQAFAHCIIWPQA